MRLSRSVHVVLSSETAVRSLTARLRKNAKRTVVCILFVPLPVRLEVMTPERRRLHCFGRIPYRTSCLVDRGSSLLGLT